jgi:aconitate decarboxylase
MTFSGQRLEDRLVDHVSRTRFEDLPPEVVAYCKLLIIDSLGVTFPGSHAPGCRDVAELFAKWASPSGSSVLIYGSRTIPPMAALLNSMMMHALDFDDTLDASALHTFVTVLPAALAAAETVKPVTGKTLITALVLGVDVICRLSLGITRPLSWIRTATCGSFGAAAAAAKVIGLDRDRLHHALGVVYSQTSGNAQGLIEGRLVKRMQPGFAAQAGVTSALLAENGITGSREFLEGRYGFYNLYEQGSYEVGPVLSDLGSHYTIADLSIKPYPCCRMTHAAIDAALDLRKKAVLDIQEIDGIDVTASKMVAEMVGKPFLIGPNPQVDAQFSIPYTVSTALVRGDVFLKDFEVSAIADEQVAGLARKVRTTVNPDLSDNDIFHADIVIRMKTGDDRHTSVDIPLGNPAKPMSIDQCKEKFKKCIVSSRVVFNPEKTTRLLELIEDLENIPDIREILSLMTVPTKDLN